MNKPQRKMFYAVSNGQPLAYGLRGIFGYQRGVLIPASDLEHATMFSGKPRNGEPPELTQAIARTLRVKAALASSVIYDWAKVKPLLELGNITVQTR